MLGTLEREREERDSAQDRMSHRNKMKITERRKTPNRERGREK